MALMFSSRVWISFGISKQLHVDDDIDIGGPRVRRHRRRAFLDEMP